MNRDQRQEAEADRQAVILKRKFGSDWLGFDALCKVCGLRYGEHYGPTCPAEVDPAE